MVHLFHGQEVAIHQILIMLSSIQVMLDKISRAYFVDYPSVSDHKPLIVYCKKITTDESFLLPKKKICKMG